jgi:hypothetical protein
MIIKPQSLYRTVSKIASVTRDVLLALMGLLCLALGIIVALGDKLPAAGVFFTAGLLLCVFSSLSRFESVKGLGIEAKMAALDNKLDEADKLLAHIRDSVGLLADISFQSMARIGFWDAVFPKQDALIIADAIRKQLRGLGESEAEINRRMAPWHKTNIRELARPFYQGILTFVDIQRQQFSEKMRDLQQPINPADAEYTRLSDLLSRNGDYMKMINEGFGNDAKIFVEKAEDIINVVTSDDAQAKSELITSLMPLIDDARHYMTHMDFRDRQRWVDTPYS